MKNEWVGKTLIELNLRKKYALNVIAIRQGDGLEINIQLKVAPEHCSAAVLDKMGKPHIEAYKKFAQKYFAISKKIKKEQYLVPYLMSSHPGSTLKDAIELALFLKEQKLRPQQVQDFYPTPGTISTCMFYTGIDPYTMKKIYVPKTKEEKAEQRALLQYFRPENKQAVIAALTKAGRKDLIGNRPECLVSPTVMGHGTERTARRKGSNTKQTKNNKINTNKERKFSKNVKTKKNF